MILYDVNQTYRLMLHTHNEQEHLFLKMTVHGAILELQLITQLHAFVNTAIQWNNKWEVGVGAEWELSVTIYTCGEVNGLFVSTHNFNH